MKRLIFLLSLLVPFLLIQSVFSQSPEAKSLMTKTIDNLNSSAGYTGEFAMNIYFGSDLEHTEKGKFATANDKILLDLASYKYLSDGKSSWTYIKDRNEVQINDVSSDDFAMYNPATLLDHFFAGGFEYEITNKFVKEEKDFAKIDFKPTDRDSEYAKISVIIATKEYLPSKFLIIQKDGNRFEIALDNIDKSGLVDETMFVFNKTDYPDALIEDLRLGE